MRIAVIGTGGVGGYFGAKLAKAGFDVSFLARGEHLEAIQKRGLEVKSILGDFRIDNVTATSSLQDMQPADLVILGVKAWQVKEIRIDLKAIMHHGTAVIPLQNGVLAAGELGEVIDASHIVGGLCRIISKIESPGVINHFGITPAIVFGELDKSDSERVRDIKRLFDRAGICAQISSDIEADVWKKFIAICVSGLLAVTRSTYGEIRELRETRQMMTELMREIHALSREIGINIESDFVDRTVSFIDTFPYDSTSSLTRDVWEGKPSEIDYQNGTVVKLGEKYELDTPINRFVYNCILPMESKARKTKDQSAG